MWRIPVYKAEQEAGLGDLVRANASLAYCSPIQPWVRDEAKTTSLSVTPLSSAQASLSDFDLHFLQTILVSTGWNKNDDVFDPLEVWVARHTPEHKPFNYEHDCSQIIGHIISNWVMDEQGGEVEDEALADSLPAKFHVVTGAVLYKHWAKPELQEKMDVTLEEIAKGEWKVSMECLFRGFDYALVDSAGETRVVARNEQTAFLTKHLRAYGGTGQYGDYRVGRMLRNIVFSGKGLVRNPANPESIILSEAEAQAETLTFSAASSGFSQVFAEQVYQPVSDAQVTQEQESKKMELEAQVAQLKTENDELKARAEKAEGLLAQASETITTLQAEATKARDEAQAVATQLGEVRDELAQLYADQRAAARISAVKEQLALEGEDAEEFVKANESLTDEQFSKQVEILSKTMAKHSAAPSLPAQQQTQPAPQFDEAEEVTEASLATTETDSGVNEVQKAIASFFGLTDDSSDQ